MEYWFPRPNKDELAEEDKPPLIILGGGREIRDNYGYYETDDSKIDREVGEVLRDFLPAVFPDKFEKGREPEREWVRVFIF